MLRRLALAFVIVATHVAGAVAPAAAHRVPVADPLPTAPAVLPVPSLTEVLTSAAPASAPPWAAIAVVSIAALAVAWRPRRVVALTLVLVAGVLAFETGVHSAHHLGQADEAARCAVAAMATQLSADLAGTALTSVPVQLVQILVAALAAPVVVARPVAPDAGRAPPVLSA